METYLCDKTFLLLHGIIDQVHSLNSMLNVPSPAVVEISPYILARTKLEYLSKLTYLTDPQTSERIPRMLRCLYADLQEFSKLPRDLTSPTGRRLAEDRCKIAMEWYSELTNGERKIQAVKMLEIFEELAGEEIRRMGKLQLGGRWKRVASSADVFKGVSNLLRDCPREFMGDTALWSDQDSQ